MKIAIIGANGKSGTAIASEALSRDHAVTKIVRSGKGDIVKDLFALTYEDIKDFDAIVNAFAAWTHETLDLHIKAAEHLCGILSGKPNRLLIVGGAGSLYVNPEHTVMLMDTPEFPAMFMGVAKATGESLEVYRKAHDVKWTYMSPAADYRADGPRTGTYRLGGEELMVDSQGVPQISYADLAIAMVDVIEKNGNIGKRISVVTQ